ncbi:MAG: hypothetical protein ACLP9L_42125, partial [Thermoguttaceae bacterium]
DDREMLINAIAGQQRRWIDCCKRVERLVQPLDIFCLATSAQIIDLGIIIMHANVSRGDRVSPKFIIVKGLDDALKRLRLGRRSSRENCGGQRRSGHEFH